MRWLMVLMIGLLPAALAAKTVEGVNLPEQVSVEGKTLMLNGAGVRTKLFFDIYVAALYLPAPSADADKILQTDQPWRLDMHFLYSEVSKEKLDEGWDEGFEENTPASERGILAERLERFKAMFPTLHEGDVVVLAYSPGKGVSVSIKGVQQGTIAGADFAQALLRVWLGAEPVTGKLKKALLGGR
ncbi:chalcone isomerase family protein [Thiolapillus sp.]